jgi:hypothetical protein
MNFHVTNEMARQAQERGQELRLEAQKMSGLLQVLKSALLLERPSPRY